MAAISKMLPSTLPSPPVALALPITADILALYGNGERPTVGRIIRQGGMGYTPKDVRRATAPLVALRAVRWESDGTLSVLEAPCVRRELHRLSVCNARIHRCCALCGKRGQRGRQWFASGACKTCRQSMR